MSQDSYMQSSVFVLKKNEDKWHAIYYGINIRDVKVIKLEVHQARDLWLDIINTKINRISDNVQYKEISKEVFQYMLDMDNAFGLFLESKANGSLEHIQELLVGVGLAMNSKGEIIDTVTNCLVEGVTQTQYFSKGSTGIVALYAKSSETAKPGYLGKKLSNICEKVKLAEDIDCGTKKLLSISTINPNFLKSFIGQYFSEKNNADRSQLKEFTKDDINKYVNKTIYFRSPLYCKSQGHNICQTCYNQEFIRNHSLKKGDNIGLFTSTGLTGSLVNLTLKKSHTGINIKNEKVNFLKDLGIE